MMEYLGKTNVMDVKKALCTATLLVMDRDQFKTHNENEMNRNYGTLWPVTYSGWDNSWPYEIPIVDEPRLARYLGVSKVWIRYEGANPTGSMKDYLVRRAVHSDEGKKASAFSVVSSGNHAVSLAHFAREERKKCIIFVPENTSKLPILRKFENAQLVCVKDAIFEDVYRFAQNVELPGVYNANVSNDFLMTQVGAASRQIVEALGDDLPTHILSGVGNGSYLSGLAFGFESLNIGGIKMVPVGMKGAFPTEKAFKEQLSHVEYHDFLHGERNIEAAEGSIACASYSMPQLMYALRITSGFTLGGLDNNDLTHAYTVLVRQTESFKLGHVPEPTGIMSLAAVLKHRRCFSKKDKVMLSFTGAGHKDLEGLERCGGVFGKELIQKAIHHAPKKFKTTHGYGGTVPIVVDKRCAPQQVRMQIEDFLQQEVYA